MSEADDPTREFLRKVDGVFHEYEQGYMDADAAMNAVELYVDELREDVE